MTTEQRCDWLRAMMERYRRRNWPMYLAFQHELHMIEWDYVRRTSKSGIEAWPTP